MRWSWRSAVTTCSAASRGRQHRGAAHGDRRDRITTDADVDGAVADLAAASEQPLRVVTVVDATTAGGRSRAQAAAQLSRAVHPATANQVDAFAISVESAHVSVLGQAVELAAYLVSDAGTATLSGAELVVAEDWLGLRSHPRPAGPSPTAVPTSPAGSTARCREMAGGSNR